MKKDNGRIDDILYSMDCVSKVNNCGFSSLDHDGWYDNVVDFAEIRRVKTMVEHNLSAISNTNDLYKFVLTQMVNEIIDHSDHTLFTNELEDVVYRCSLMVSKMIEICSKSIDCNEKHIENQHETQFRHFSLIKNSNPNFAKTLPKGKFTLVTDDVQ